MALPLRSWRSRRRHVVRVDCARRTAEIGGRKNKQNARGHADSDHQQRTKILLPRRPKRKLIGNSGHVMNLPALRRQSTRSIFLGSIHKRKNYSTMAVQEKEYGERCPPREATRHDADINDAADVPCPHWKAKARQHRMSNWRLPNVLFGGNSVAITAQFTVEPSGKCRSRAIQRIFSGRAGHIPYCYFAPTTTAQLARARPE